MKLDFVDLDLSTKAHYFAFTKKMKINGKHIMWTWITQHKSLERVFFTMYEISTIIVEEEYQCKRSYILVSICDDIVWYSLELLSFSRFAFAKFVLGLH